MVEYLPCSTNTWELFGINQTTVLEEYLDALPDQSTNTSSHYNNIYELNELGEYGQVLRQKNCSNLAPSVDIESTFSESSLPCSQYLGDYLMLANIIESHSEEATFLFQCSVCGKRSLTSNQETCSANDMKRTDLCKKCDETMISPDKLNISVNTAGGSDELNQCMSCEEHFTKSIHEQHLSIHGISKQLQNPGQQVSVQSGQGNVVECQDCGGKLKYQSITKKGEEKSSYIICRKPCTVDERNINKISSYYKKSRNISNYNCGSKNNHSNAYENMSDKKGDNSIDNDDINGIVNSPVEYKWDIKEKYLGSQVQFDRHVGDCHIKEKPFRCNICGKHFKWNGNLKVHMRIHSGERPFHCDDCGKRFSASNDLRRHKRRHTGEMPYKCSTCSMSFKSNSEMKQHGKIHQGDRPHQCDECGKRFISRSNLKTHMRVHSGERPYKCMECSRTFVTSTNLKNHQRIHSGIKPYLCPVCGKQFSQSNNLNIHKKTHERHEDE